MGQGYGMSWAGPPPVNVPLRRWQNLPELPFSVTNSANIAIYVFMKERNIQNGQRD
jgi:hypothetical protein